MGLQFERLENRVLLAVNVTQDGAILYIGGDGEADEVFVDGTGVTGEVEVFSGTESLGVFSNVNTIVATLRGGDDSLTVAAIDITGSLRVRMGDGADTFVLHNAQSTLGGGVDGNVSIGDDLRIKMGRNEGDVARLVCDIADSGISVTNNLRIWGVADLTLDGEGESSDADLGDISVGGNLKITSTVGADIDDDDLFSIFVDNVNVAGKTYVRLGAGDESVSVTNSSFLDRVVVRLRDGDDSFTTEPGVDPVADVSNFFGAGVRIRGGNGNDLLDPNLEDEFTVDPTVIDFEDEDADI